MTRSLRLPSEPNSATLAVRFAEAAVRDESLPLEVLDRVVLAVGEAVSNAIRHGNASDPARTVLLGWSGEGGGGWIHVEDEGQGIDAAQIEQAVLPSDPLQQHGRGLYLIRILSDQIRIEGPRLSLWFEPRD